ncbi:fatty acid synthase-like [Coccinella septempunctata]|uniref:fatty acid synthase-like n=1 Tax=Coccinella septempunctata TaxID=41139 RepID=UPI001D06B2EB|nr:fatty acid synthase-like [Coccinella septempunctata]
MDPDSIVISGMAGRFPGCDNVEELQKALLDGVDLVSEDHGRWTKNFFNMNNRGGVMKDIEHFDSEFFGISPRQVDGLDPRTRILLELTFEAFIDAGFNPLDMRGSKTAVLVGLTTPRGNEELFDNKVNFERMGRSPAMTTGMISFIFDLRGPSYPIDTACSSSLYAFCQAFRAIKAGEYDSAIVCGATITLDPFDNLEYQSMNILSPSGKCKFLDENRDGFVKSESVVVTFLQKRKDARRVYATVKGCGTNTDGYKVDGVTKPSPEMQTVLFTEVMKEFNIKPQDITYIEAHGTGTPVGDVQETEALAASICVGREEPLLIGSVKTNIGHTEMSSGLTSVIKVVLTMESGIIPRMLHLNKIGDEFTAFHEGKLKAVTEQTTWKNGLIGVNSFGLGGTNAHVILEANNKEKVSYYSKMKYRLLVLSGRNDQGLKNFMDFVKNEPRNLEKIMFLNHIFYKPLRSYKNRAYLIFKDGNITEEVGIVEKENRKIWFVYSGIGSQWPHMCRDLMSFDLFKKSMEECAKPLRPYKIDLINIATEGDAEVFKNVTNCFVSIVAMSICLTDILKYLGISPDGMIGHSIGEICCAYCDGLITKEQAILIAHARGVALEKTSSIDGTLAVIGLTLEELTETIPPDLSIACYNSLDNFTISGPRNSITEYVKELKKMNKFAEIIEGANKAYHSEYISDAGDYLLKLLKSIIPENKIASRKWISSSENESISKKCEEGIMNDVEALSDEPVGVLHCPEYYRRNLVGPVYFSSAMKSIPEDALVIEISPKGLLQTIIRRNLGQEAKVLSLSSDSSEDNHHHLLSSIGRLYLAGLHPNILKLYGGEKVFPVSRGTPSLAPLIQWERTMTCKVPYYSPEKAFGESIVVDIRNPSMSYLEGHVINDKLIYPVMGYANIVWEIFSHLKRKPLNEVPIVIENMKIRRATMLPKDGNVIFNVNILTNGDFEILEGGAIVCTGSIKSPPDTDKLFTQLSEEHLTYGQLPENCVMNTEDVYFLLKLSGYQYKNKFQGIIETRGSTGRLKWHETWTAFLDAAIHFTGVTNLRKEDYLPESIGMILIDPQAHLKIAAQNNNEIPIKHDKIANIIQCGKMEIRDLKLIEISKRKSLVKPILQTHRFIPYDIPENISFHDCVHTVLQIVLENSNNITAIQILEVGENNNQNGVDSNEPSNSNTDSLLSEKLKEVLSEDIIAKIVHDIKHEQLNSKEMNRYNLVILHSQIDEEILASLRENQKCFILLRKSSYDIFEKTDYVIVSTFTTVLGAYVLIRLKQEIPRDVEIIRITTKTFDWVNTLKESMIKNVGTRIYLVSENEETSGVLGLYTCMRYEDGGNAVRCVFIPGAIPEKFSLESSFFRQQLEKDLCVNIFKNSVWGSYRFLEYEKVESVDTEHCNAVSTVPGNLSKIKMVENCSHFSDPKNLIYVYYAGVNFKDVLVANGMLNIPGDDRNTTQIGYEYSGRTSDGQRVFGVTNNQAFGTTLVPDYPPIKIPDSWSMEEAASVPLVYITLFCAFRYKTKLQKGRSILIHSASGGVGMAAIQLALAAGCTIFATVGSDEKKKILLKVFPQLQEKHIFNSRDSNFEIMIKRETNGRGVDYVLNSLTGDLFKASLRCVASNGHFIEIGKTEFLNNTRVQTDLFTRSVSLHAISIDEYLMKEPKSFLDYVLDFLKNGIENDIKPIPHREVFGVEEIESALKHFQSDSHCGKIILKIRDEEESNTTLPLPRKMRALAKVHFNPNKSYIIIGGLGGLGLELMKIICSSGGKHVILNTRTPPANGYRNYVIQTMNTWGCDVHLNHYDTSIFSNADKLLREALSKAPIGGIFNLAMVNRDAILENQTVEYFRDVFRPKAEITRNLDELSRTLCPNLDHFVVYSSITCGKGNLGQTNYGFANSSMERIIEKRNEDGLPGIAIQWGPIGDVGYFARTNEKQELGYFKAQPVLSYQEVIKQVLLKSSGIITSYVVHKRDQDIEIGDSLTGALLKIFGINNSSKIDDGTTLIDLGMDSLMGFEIKQFLLREHEIDISIKELRNMTMKEIKEIDVKRKHRG